MQDWKTTITALVGAVASLLAHYGLNLGPDVQMVIVTLTLAAVGYLSKDKSKP